MALADVITPVCFGRYRENLVFFRELPSGTIGILSVLRARSDLPVRLSEDLALLGNAGGLEE